MLRSFFLVAFRNLRKNGLYTFINISGLSVGIVSAILIVLWVIDEVSFDKFIPKYDRLYQVWISSEFDDRINNWRSVPLPTYDAMKTIDSNIKNSAVSGWGGDRLLTVGDTRLIKHGYYVSEEFLEMFEFPLVAGSATEALRDPLSIVLSESLAKLLFGEEDPIGKQVKLSDQGTLMVTAIVEDVPENSTFQFDYLATWKYRESVTEWVKENRTNCGNYSFQVYVELNDPSREFDVEESIAGLLMEKDGGDGLDKHFFLHPMTKWRLYSNFDDDGEESGGRSDYVQLFTVVAIVILIIACINFMNLSTARSEKRAKEVGIRKSLGSNRGRLIGQFIGESTLITFLAFFLAIILTQLILPSYNQLVDKQLMINYTSWHFWVGTFGGIAILGLASGSYPAFYLSSFHPVKTLKGSIKAGKGASTPRKVLVVSQFVFYQIYLLKNDDGTDHKKDG
ncbi:MAG: ABC transporter permease, partial [Bacteroidota bacterium]